MSEKSPTRGWFAVGMGLIILAGAIYGLMIIAGIGFAITTASQESGAPIWAIMFVPALMVLGFAVLLAKVVVDRLTNAEDDHYSRTVDKQEPAQMIVTMAETVPNRQIADVIGIVKGNTVRTRFFGRDIMAALRNLIGGEVPEYTKLMAEAREQAIDRMTADGQAKGADAIINMRVTTSMIMGGSAELLAYGTAVRLR